MGTLGGFPCPPAMEPAGLGGAFGEVLERIKNRPVYEVESADVTVGDMIRYLRDQFRDIAPIA